MTKIIHNNNSKNTARTHHVMYAKVNVIYKGPGRCVRSVIWCYSALN